VRPCENVTRIGTVWRALVEADELTRRLVRQGREQHRLDDAEHGRRAPNAQAERGHDVPAKPALPRSWRQRVAKVLRELLEPSMLFMSWMSCRMRVVSPSRRRALM
jgi:hypothetical protein